MRRLLSSSGDSKMVREVRRPRELDLEYLEYLEDGLFNLVGDLDGDLEGDKERAPSNVSDFSSPMAEISAALVRRFSLLKIEV